MLINTSPAIASRSLLQGVAGGSSCLHFFNSMNKDALLATLIGFVIGLLITGVLLVGPRVVRYLPKIKIPQWTISQPHSTPTPSPAQKEFSITIDSPLPDSIESESEVLVSGSTTSKATVVIQSNVNDAATQAKDDGKYAGKVTLVEGRNEISVTSYLKDKKATQTIMVFYTPENL